MIFKFLIICFLLETKIATEIKIQLIWLLVDTAQLNEVRILSTPPTGHVTAALIGIL